jgi:hypothetical protein
LVHKKTDYFQEAERQRLAATAAEKQKRNLMLSTSTGPKQEQ